MSSIRLKFLGGAWVEANEAPVSGRAVQRRRLALLAILAAARGMPVSRDRILGLLWADSGMQQARHLLSVALHEMRRLLGEDVINTTTDGISLSRSAVWCDVIEFEHAIAAGADADAIALYDGPFLDGFHLSDAAEFEQWVDGERERFARVYRAALERRAQALEAVGDASGAVEMWRRLATADPFNSRVALALMTALEAAGDRASAIRHARVHAAFLRDELDADAPAEVTELAEKLRTAPPRAAATVDAAVPAAPALPPVAVTRAPAAPPTPIRPRRRVQRRRRLLWGAIAVAGTLGMITLFVRQYASRPDLPDNTLVVRPLVALNAGSDSGFADGLTIELIARMRDIDSLDVKATTSSFAFADPALTSRDIAQRLGARYILEGSVRREGDGLRIILELVDARNNRTIWDGDYDRTRGDVIAVQKEVAHEVADELTLQLRATAAAPCRPRDPRNVEAYELYLIGHAQFMRRTPASLLAAAQTLERAVAIEPTYALAQAALAHTYNLLGAYDYGLRPPREAYGAARRASEHARRLDPCLAEAHAALAVVLMNHDRDYVGAEREFRRALQLNAEYDQARHWYALLLAALGRDDEAMKQTERARELEPFSSVVAAGLARQHYFRGDYPAAIERYRTVLEGDPAFAPAQTGLALTFDVSGDPARAVREYARLISDSARVHPLWLALQAHALARAGDTVSARARLRQLEERAHTGFVPAEYFAIVHTGLGDLDEALMWLERAEEQGSGGMLYLNVEPLLDPLRGLPRFRQLVDKVGLQQTAPRN